MQGPFRQRDLEQLLPVANSVVVVGIKGAQIKRLLEAGVSSWPELVGRFLQVRACRYLPSRSSLSAPVLLVAVARSAV